MNNLLDTRIATLCFFILCFLGACLSASKKTVPPPNVVVLYTDDQRFNTIHAWGNEEIHTPNMDRLCQMGVSFPRAYVMGSHHGAVCAPSRAMLLSGKPYFNIPRSYIDQGLADYQSNFNFTTFPEYFREKGYATFFTGKWHNHTSKLRQGFEDGKNVFIGGMHFPNVGGHRNPELWEFDETGEYLLTKKRKGDYFSSQMYSDAAIEFLEKQKEENPFCLYVAFTSPHDPREAPAEYLELYDTSKITLPPNFLPEHPFDNGHLGIRDELLAPFPRTPEIIKSEIAAYYAMVTEVDAQIGRILDQMESKNLLKNTIIIFAGDNGLAVGQHGLLGKQNLYEHSARVPLIIAAPNIEGNRKSETLCYIHDIFPTICELSGGDIPASVEGKSLLLTLHDHNKQIREEVFLSHAVEQRAIRTHDDWKLIRYFVNGTHHTQLYNLKKDTWEMENLANLPQFQSKQKTLSEALCQHILTHEDDFLKPSIQLKYEDFGKPVAVTISKPLPEINLRYTLDGTKPTKESDLYKSEFLLKEKAIIKAQLFMDGKGIGPVVETTINISDIRAARLAKAPSQKYKANGVYTLFDGQRGSIDFKDQKSLGYEGEDLEVVIDLGEERLVSSISFGYVKQYNSWIFPPKGYEVFISENGKDFQSVAKENILIDELNKSPEVLTIQKNINSRKVRHVKIRIKNYGVCPEWHAGAGSKSWLFVDEIRVM